MRIKRLDERTIKRIAAGEVITSPAAVVKELVENSLDAESKKIVIELRRGGKELIKVMDDGTGMTREEVIISIERYTTSKIKSIEDLTRLGSYGFRGEALASIKEVSRMVIESSVDPFNPGTRIEIEEGEIKKILNVSRERGTTVYVFSLFYNLPVRKHNLRSDGYELKRAIDVIKNYAMVYNDISFRVITEKGTLINLIPDQERKRIESIMEDGRAKFLKEFNIDGNPISIRGYLMDPGNIKRRAILQKVFINRRPVYYRLINKAVYEGYGIYSGEMNPDFILFFSIAPEYLDVNIHPAKERVVFKDENYLYNFVSSSIKDAIKLRKTTFSVPHYTLQSSTVYIRDKEREAEQRVLFDFFEQVEKKEYRSGLVAPIKLWQLHNEYIFAQTDEGFIIIDQHAAHERVMYERILKNMDNPKKQGLLFPISITLSSEEIEVYMDVVDELEKMGFETRMVGIDAVAFDAVPEGAYIGEEDLKEIILELQKLGRIRWKRENIAAVVACRSAIKKGQSLTHEDMERLIDELFACNEPYFCPHGRPTIIKYTLEELDRMFGRK